MEQMEGQEQLRTLLLNIEALHNDLAEAEQLADERKRRFVSITQEQVVDEELAVGIRNMQPRLIRQSTER